MNKFYTLLLVILTAVILHGCYSDTVESLSKIHIQIPLPVTAEYYNKSVPDTSFNFSNLNKYEEYTKNLDRIQKAEIIQFNYWIDSLELGNGYPYNPETDYIEFESIRFYLQFARFKDGYSDPYDLDSSHYELDPASPKYLLGEFKNINLKDYYRDPHNILEVPATQAAVISDAIKKRPHFYITTEYSNIKGQVTEKMNFPYIKSRYDVIIRLEAEL